MRDCVLCCVICFYVYSLKRRNIKVVQGISYAFSSFSDDEAMHGDDTRTTTATREENCYWTISFLPLFYFYLRCTIFIRSNQRCVNYDLFLNRCGVSCCQFTSTAIVVRLFHRHNRFESVAKVTIAKWIGTANLCNSIMNLGKSTEFTFCP